MSQHSKRLELDLNILLQNNRIGSDIDLLSVANLTKPIAAANNYSGHREIAFIDTTLPDWQLLKAGIAGGIEIALLGPSMDGLLQIATALQGQVPDRYDAIHLFSHGSPGHLYVGTADLSFDNLDDYREPLQQIGAALSDTGDLLVYGCNVAQGEVGRRFIDSIAEVTGADVGASEDLTGAVGLGGDWNLEVSSGLIDSNIFNKGMEGYQSTLYVSTGINWDKLIWAVDTPDFKLRIPTYGYFGGPGYTGGLLKEEGEGSLDSPYFDNLDQIFRIHDGAYASANGDSTSLAIADSNAIKAMLTLAPSMSSNTEQQAYAGITILSFLGQIKGKYHSTYSEGNAAAVIAAEQGIELFHKGLLSVSANDTEDLARKVEFFKWMNTSFIEISYLRNTSIDDKMESMMVDLFGNIASVVDIPELADICGSIFGSCIYAAINTAGFATNGIAATYYVVSSAAKAIIKVNDIIAEAVIDVSILGAKLIQAGLITTYDFIQTVKQDLVDAGGTVSDLVNNLIDHIDSSTWANNAADIVHDAAKAIIDAKNNTAEAVSDIGAMGTRLIKTGAIHTYDFIQAVKQDVADAGASVSNLISSLVDQVNHPPVWGSNGADDIRSGVGDDVIYGLAGNDTIYAGSGQDIIYGGTEDDDLYGEQDGDLIYAGSGLDNLYGGAGRDELYGEDDSDVLHGEGDNDTLYGGHEFDILYGDEGDDLLKGEAGNDLLYGGLDNDKLYGDEGNDKLYGQNGNDILYGGSNEDALNGGVGADTLYGEQSADTFIFDDTAITDARNAIFDTIIDYDQGNANTHYYASQEGDIIDLTAAIATLYPKPDKPLQDLVRAQQDADGKSSSLYILDTNNAWLRIAELDGIKTGNTLKLKLNPTDTSAAPIDIVIGGIVGDGSLTAFDFPFGNVDAQGRRSATPSNDGDGYYNANDFGDFTNNASLRDYHLGEDWNYESAANADLGADVHVAADGVVVFAGDGGTGWGNVVIVKHPLANGAYGGFVTTLYGHLGTLSVKVGDAVTRGAAMGVVGAVDGISPHLHFEVRSGTNPDALLVGHGYSETPRPEGWLDPTDFITGHLGDVAQATWSITPSTTTVTEAETSINLTVTRSSATTEQTVYLSTTINHGSSNEGDYEYWKNQAIVFKAGQSSYTATINIHDDTEVEGNETFGFIVQSDPNASVSVNEAAAEFTVLDDDVYVDPGVGESWTGSSESEVRSGTSGNDSYSGNGGDDELFGGGGNDELWGGSGNNTLIGNDGGDALIGGNENDFLEGGRAMTT